MTTTADYYLRDLKFADDYVENGDGDIDLVDGLQNVKDRLFRRLITLKGSIVHRPNYGVGLKRYQNETITLQLRKFLTNEIKNQFQEEQFVESVKSVIINQGTENTSQLTINVNAVISGYQELVLEFEVQ